MADPTQRVHYCANPSCHLPLAPGATCIYCERCERIRDAMAVHCVET